MRTFLLYQRLSIKMNDLNDISLSEIIKLVKSKKISSLELANHFINNIKKGKKLNSFITTCFLTKQLKTQKILIKNKILTAFSRHTYCCKRFICTKKY